MIKYSDFPSVIIACHSNDTELGNYFRKCTEEIIDCLEDKSPFIQLFENERCNEVALSICFSRTRHSKYRIFIAYSHGVADALVIDKHKYLNLDNISELHQGLLYTNACLCGQKLGKTFIGKEGAFIGFKESVNALIGNLESISIDCDNCGILYWCHKPDTTIREVVKIMRNKYDQKIDYLEEMGYGDEIISYLEEAKNALTYYGNPDLTFKGA